VLLEDAFLEVLGQEAALGVIAAEATEGLDEVVGAEGEEARPPGYILGLSPSPGQLYLRPRFKTVSIIPGIEATARTETSREPSESPRCLLITSSRFFRYSATPSIRPSGN